MEGLWIEWNDYVAGFVSKPTIVEAFVDIVIFSVPIWVAVMIGMLIGWSWRPRWTGLVFLGFRSKLRFLWMIPLGIDARRFWFAVTAFSAWSIFRRLWLCFHGPAHKVGLLDQESESSSLVVLATDKESEAADDVGCDRIRQVSRIPDTELCGITENDLEHLLHLLDGKDGEMEWQSMMERSTSNLTYQAWCHEPEMSPIVYRSKTIFEDATPELVREFFWDDEFRLKWDPMLVYVKILEECHDTGMMVMHWIKKFPFFCSDREYIIGRRIWESGKRSYCVTKGVPYPSIPKNHKPRRVESYFSSWVIKPVESRKAEGQLTACEVILVHYEDMGIPKDVAKLGVRHGMWGAVKKLNSGFRAYQNARKSEASLPRCALMSKITTKISLDEGTGVLDHATTKEENSEIVQTDGRKNSGGIDWKWVFIGGTVALVCGLQTGLLGRAVLVGAGHRISQRRAKLR